MLNNLKISNDEWETNMQVLATGGAGFIGSNFIHYILKKHQTIEIINYDKLTYAGNLQKFKPNLDGNLQCPLRKVSEK